MNKVIGRILAIGVVGLSLFCMGCGAEKQAQIKVDPSWPLEKQVETTAFNVSKYAQVIKIEDKENLKYLYLAVALPKEESELGKQWLYREDAKVLQQISKDYPQIDRVFVANFVHVVDKYGKESEAIGMSYVISKETLNKINWEKFNPSNLRDISEQYNVAPFMK